MIQLVRPDVAYATSYVAAMREFQREGRYPEFDFTADFACYVAILRDHATVPRHPAVLETHFWLVDDALYIGRVSIRHQLNDRLRRLGGHIGYDIRPSQRQRGYGQQILALALPQARAMDLKSVLLTCDSDNWPSRKIIESNGGVFEDEIQLPDRPVPTRRYWIALID
jgi:predicted acetyltransferase